jgi:hypothetical protein
MAIRIAAYLNCHVIAAHGQTSLTRLRISLETEVVDVAFPTTATLTSAGTDEVGAIAIGSTEAAFNDTSKAVFSLISPPHLLLYAGIFHKFTTIIMLDRIDPRFLKVCCVSRAVNWKKAMSYHPNPSHTSHPPTIALTRPPEGFRKPSGPTSKYPPRGNLARPVVITSTRDTR